MLLAERGVCSHFMYREMEYCRRHSDDMSVVPYSNSVAEFQKGQGAGTLRIPTSNSSMGALLVCARIVATSSLVWMGFKSQGC